MKVVTMVASLRYSFEAVARLNYSSRLLASNTVRLSVDS